MADSLADVLDGEVRHNLTVGCGEDEEAVWAQASGSLPAWLPGAPELAFSIDTRARREMEP